MAERESLSPYTLSIIRMLCAWAFLNHSAPALVGYFMYQNSHELSAVYWAVRWVEFLASSLLLLGLFATTASLILLFNAIFIYLYWNIHESIYPTTRSAVILVLLAGICAHIAVTGPGRWSLDTIRTSKP